MSPEVAAEAYKTYVNPFAGKAKLIAPAITNGGAPMGTDWLDRFLAACGTDCHIDGFAFHIYDSASNTDYFKTYISDFVSKYSKDGKECLLTEVRTSYPRVLIFRGLIVPQFSLAPVVLPRNSNSS